MTIPSSFGAGVGLGLGGRIAVYGRRIIVLFRSSWFSFLLPDLNLITSHAHDSIRWIDISGLRSSNCGTGLPLLFACFSFQSIFWFRDFVLEDGIRTPLHFPALSKFFTVSVRSGRGLYDWLLLYCALFHCVGAIHLVSRGVIFASLHQSGWRFAF